MPEPVVGLLQYAVLLEGSREGGLLTSLCVGGEGVTVVDKAGWSRFPGGGGCLR